MTKSTWDTGQSVPSGNLIANATIRYGAQFALDDLTVQNSLDQQMQQAAADQNTPVVEYGAPMCQSAAAITPAQRDEWWKWALGAGVISFTAYMLYRTVTINAGVR